MTERTINIKTVDNVELKGKYVKTADIEGEPHVTLIVEGGNLDGEQVDVSMSEVFIMYFE